MVDYIRVSELKWLRCCRVEVGGCAICTSYALEGTVNETVVEEDGEY